MKQQVIAVFLLAALTLTLLAGCQSANADTPIATDPPLAWNANNKAPEMPEARFQPEKPVEPETPAQPEQQLLTAAEAEAIALAHAGLTVEEVVFDRTEIDREKGKTVYEVEFSSGEYGYEYTIDAVTGQVIYREKEYDPKPIPPVPEVPVQPEPPSQPEKPVEPETPAQPEQQPLTAAEAEAIALAHAGLTGEEVIFEPTETDREKGKTVYEVEFRKGNWEYSYEIDAETGKILEWEKEYDD